MLACGVTLGSPITGYKDWFFARVDATQRVIGHYVAVWLCLGRDARDHHSLDERRQALRHAMENNIPVDMWVSFGECLVKYHPMPTYLLKVRIIDIYHTLNGYGYTAELDYTLMRENGLTLHSAPPQTLGGLHYTNQVPMPINVMRTNHRFDEPPIVVPPNAQPMPGMPNTVNVAVPFALF